VLHQVGIEAREPLIIPLLSESLRFEPVERRGERDARLPPLARGQHPKGGVLGQPLGVVGVLVARETAVDRLAEQIGQRELEVAPGPRIGEVLLDQRAQAEPLIQLALGLFLARRRDVRYRHGAISRWSFAWFGGLGLHRLKGTVRYPGAAHA
jgi:hypothetical protein